MRFDSGETYVADKPIWAWLLRHAGWQLSRYKQKGNESFLSGFPNQRSVLCKEEDVGTRATRCSSRVSDEHIVLTPGGRVFE